MPFGPQSGSGIMSPTPQQPQPGDPMAEWSMQNTAQQQALMHAMRGMIGQQQQGTLQNAGMLGARLGNQALGNPVGAALRPIGQAIKSAVSYTTGGQSTLAANSPALANSAAQSAYGGASAATPAATQASTAAASSPSLLGVAGQGLGIAAAGFGAYQGFTGAQKSLDNLHDAISYGLSDEDAMKLREATFRSGAQGSAIGAIGGGLGGSAYGPVGTVVGAALGGAPGAYQAWQSADTGGERWDMQREFMKNPFRR